MIYFTYSFRHNLGGYGLVGEPATGVPATSVCQYNGVGTVVAGTEKGQGLARFIRHTADRGAPRARHCFGLQLCLAHLDLRCRRWRHQRLPGGGTRADPDVLF